jgi:hypothetical protein
MAEKTPRNPSPIDPSRRLTDPYYSTVLPHRSHPSTTIKVATPTATP